MRTEKQMLAAVHRGSRMLDKKNPGWLKQVRLTTLNMGLTDDCILGQLYETFYNGLDELLLEHDDDTVGPNGFDCTEKEYDEAEDLDIVVAGAYRDKIYAALTRLWKDEIRERKANLAAPKVTPKRK